MIDVEPLLSDAGPEMLRRLKLLGYRYFGIFLSDNDGIQKDAIELGLRVIYWQQRKSAKGIEGFTASAQVAASRFTFLKIPLNFRFQETRAYVRRYQSKLDALALSFKEIREMFKQNDASRIADTIGRLRALLLSTNTGLLVYSEAASPEELVSPVSYEYLLSLILNRNEPMNMLRMKKTYDRLLQVSI
ncbi:MAG: hypothetical protein QXX17_04475 [Conexivisphaerales archaeon]